MITIRLTTCPPLTLRTFVASSVPTRTPRILPHAVRRLSSSPCVITPRTARTSIPARMRAYCPHSPMVGVGWLEGWRLTFAGEGDIGWEGAVTTIVESPGDRVFVSLYDVHPWDAAQLDEVEGVTAGAYQQAAPCGSPRSRARSPRGCTSSTATRAACRPPGTCPRSPTRRRRPGARTTTSPTLRARPTSTAADLSRRSGRSAAQRRRLGSEAGRGGPISSTRSVVPERTRTPARPAVGHRLGPHPASHQRPHVRVGRLPAERDRARLAVRPGDDRLQRGEPAGPDGHQVRGAAVLVQQVQHHRRPGAPGRSSGTGIARHAAKSGRPAASAATTTRRVSSSSRSRGKPAQVLRPPAAALRRCSAATSRRGHWRAASQPSATASGAMKPIAAATVSGRTSPSAPPRPATW